MKTTREELLKAAETNPEAKEALKKLFPEAFDCVITKKDDRYYLNDKRVYMDVRGSGEYRDRAIYLRSNFNYELVVDSSGLTCLVVREKL